jgi:hypothetical protein
MADKKISELDGIASTDLVDADLLHVVDVSVPVDKKLTFGALKTKLLSGFGNSATRNVGTIAGTVAAGNDSRLNRTVNGESGDITIDDTTLNALDPTSEGVTRNLRAVLERIWLPLSEMTPFGKSLIKIPNVETFRSDVGLGNSAARDVGTGALDVAAGNHGHDGISSGTTTLLVDSTRVKTNKPFLLQRNSSTGALRDAAQLDAIVTNSSDASFTADFVAYTASAGGGLNESFRVNSNDGGAAFNLRGRNVFTVDVNGDASFGGGCNSVSMAGEWRINGASFLINGTAAFNIRSNQGFVLRDGAGALYASIDPAGQYYVQGTRVLSVRQPAQADSANPEILALQNVLRAHGLMA